MPVSRFPFPAASIYDLIEKQSRTAGNGTRRQAAEAVRPASHHSDVVVIALQHHRQHLHRPRRRSDGHQRAGHRHAADEPHGGLRVAGRRRSLLAHLHTSGTGQQTACIPDTQQRHHAERGDRTHLHHAGAHLPRRHSLLLRRKRPDHPLRPRLHAHHPVGQRHNP